MAFDYYVDIRVIPSAESVDLSLPSVRNQVYKVLHGAFRTLAADSLPFALAIVASPKLLAKQEALAKKYDQTPRFDFDIFRVFSVTDEALQRLVDTINNHWTIRDYAVVGAVALVPTAKISGWQSYRRFRIPTAKMERSKLSHDLPPLHERRLQQAKTMPFLKIQSKSTGQSFTLVIDKVEATDAGHGLPDSYGLARASQPFALPIF
ncbi:type I-F CRISPR-associated endoribonuclease Cas6/Csy4 [Psychrobacter ciconiae]|uniref:type I-F CRISPR-associated endoribonuclease Cas6/Csy4 n=1 Tax=Psychrobacter ciconiae TaxID=1553449 RepID=UPI00191831CD|nr:type I-F CRISPR-associated endoribonuclease Cas6/Csy4 [Psychrobacter ciconiae]